MWSESERRFDVKSKISTDLEIILQFSFWLTKNGLDATRLVREATAEAYRSWDESMPEESCRKWLHGILTRRFSNGVQQDAHPPVPIAGANVNESHVRSDRLAPFETTDAEQPSRLTGESLEDVTYLNAITGLHAMIRPAIILSYLEGFTSREIGDIAGAEPQVVESLLKRGRGLLREKLFAHLMGSDGPETFADRAATSG